MSDFGRIIMTNDVAQSKQFVLGELLARWARKAPNREAVVFRDKRLTFREFDVRVNRLANGLAGLGVQRGDRVGFIFTNCNEYVECALALAKLGAIGVPCNFRFGAKEHAYQLSQSEAKALIFGEQFNEVVREAKADLPELTHTICAGKSDLPGALHYEEIIDTNSPEPPNVYVDDNDPASIMYTSGTTGRPKGVVLTHKNLISSCVTYLYHVGRLDDQRVLIVLPLFHVAAYGAFIFNLFSGSTTVISSWTDPVETMAALQNENITTISLVPTLWNMVVNHPKLDQHDFSSLKICWTAGAIMPVELKNRIVERFPGIRIIEAFAMTETSAIGTFADHEDMFRKHGTVGRPAFNADVRVVDDNGQDVPVGEIGEIVYRGPGILKEYYRNPEATANAFKNGWFYSGDLVRQDEDGYIFVVDRKKDIIISGGENISAVEVEEVIIAHPKILDVAVVGVPDSQWGESIKAYVVLRPGEILSEEEVIAWCKESLASFKKPRYVEFVEELQRSATGKVKKFALRERALQEMTSGRSKED